MTCEITNIRCWDSATNESGSVMPSMGLKAITPKGDITFLKEDPYKNDHFIIFSTLEAEALWNKFYKEVYNSEVDKVDTKKTSIKFKEWFDAQ